MKQYKVIFLDWDKTLSNHFRNELVQTSGRSRLREVIDFLFIDTSIGEQWMRGEISEHDVDLLISKRFGYPVFLIRVLRIWSFRSVKIASNEILSIVTRLRSKGIKCVIATNNMDTFKTHAIPRLKLKKYFDDILISCDLKTLKFDVNINDKTIPFFDDYLKRNGFNYTDALLIDDQIDTSGVYKKLGIDIFQVQNPQGLLEKLTELNQL